MERFFLSFIIKSIESSRIEFSLLSVFAISIGLSISDVSWATRSLHISFLILVPLYLLRMIVSLRHWKLSRGISAINAYLNFQIANALLAIGFTFLMFPGYHILTYNALLGPQLFMPIIAIFLFFRWNKINGKLYWDFSKWNFAKMLIGTATCLIIFYAFDMTSSNNKSTGQITV